jgi:glycosyltransferase involved in cell wall biosynthesis
MEAVLLDTPAVASDIPNLKEMAGDPPAFALCGEISGVGFADAVEKLLCDGEYSRRIVQNGQQHSRALFSIEQLTSELASVINGGPFDQSLGVSSYER